MKFKPCLILLVSCFGAGSIVDVAAKEEKNAKSPTKEPTVKKLYRYVDKNGKVIDRYGSITKPQSIEKDIVKIL